MSGDHSLEEKLDLLLKSVSVLSSQQDVLANRHESSQWELNSKLKLEDVTTAQEDATGRACAQKEQEGPLYEFKQKGHKEQFDFNDRTGGH